MFECIKLGLSSKNTNHELSVWSLPCVAVRGGKMNVRLTAKNCFTSLSQSRFLLYFLTSLRVNNLIIRILTLRTFCNTLLFSWTSNIVCLWMAKINLNGYTSVQSRISYVQCAISSISLLNTSPFRNWEDFIELPFNYQASALEKQL